MLRIPAFVDDVIFSYSGPYGGVTLPQWHRSNVCSTAHNTFAAWHQMHDVLVDVEHQD